MINYEHGYIEVWVKNKLKYKYNCKTQEEMINLDKKLSKKYKDVRYIVTKPDMQYF